MLLFLDIDGVLVPEKKFDNPVPEEDLMKFDADCLHELETVLRNYPNVNVAIASSWREMFPFEAIPPLFSPDISTRVVGATPFLDPKIIISHQFEYIRYQEVLEYLRQNQAENTPWVAIDDNPKHYPPDAPIIPTDSYQGFDEKSAKVLSEYLASFQATRC
jgi:HAD domain in Swiss Army Knife RNA repair proteins